MIELWEHQELSVKKVRAAISAGHRRILLCSPTGSGKTVIGSYMLKSCADKGNRGNFFVDRISLVGQTSSAFHKFRIDHGIQQGQNTRGTWAPIQIVSQQTAEKRGFPESSVLNLVDECHTTRQVMTEQILAFDGITIGLTATPFTAGLSKIYTCVVNVCTTNELIDRGVLAPLKVYAAQEIDMDGAKINNFGEWTDGEVEERANKIIGDIVTSWTEKTQQHFGGPVKTLVFSASIAHGEELCREFQAAGFNFVQVTAHTPQEECDRIFEEFRRPDSNIHGLVSVEKLAKGFDVPDVLCGVDARPLRKSFAAHIQKIGRAMRSHPDKEFALWLDHTGNYLGFYDRMVEFFSEGVSELVDDEKYTKERAEDTKEKTDFACRECGYVMLPKMTTCPSCGAARQARKSTVETVAGQLQEVDGTVGKEKELPGYLQNKQDVWRQIVHEAQLRKGDDHEAARKFAKAQYRNFYQTWPSFAWESAGYVSADLSKAIAKNLQNFARRRSYAQRKKAA